MNMENRHKFGSPVISRISAVTFRSGDKMKGEQVEGKFWTRPDEKAFKQLMNKFENVGMKTICSMPWDMVGSFMGRRAGSVGYKGRKGAWTVSN
jgi:hypothetical protein